MPPPVKGEDGKYPAFAWPGGYPLVYLTARNEPICPRCANEIEDQFAGPCVCEDDPCGEIPCASVAREASHQQVSTVDVHWEGEPIDCDRCNESVASAYGDPSTACDECQASIPDGEEAVNSHHEGSCSLHTSNVIPSTPREILGDDLVTVITAVEYWTGDQIEASTIRAVVQEAFSRNWTDFAVRKRGGASSRHGEEIGYVVGADRDIDGTRVFRAMSPIAIPAGQWEWAPNSGAHPAPIVVPATTYRGAETVFMRVDWAPEEVLDYESLSVTETSLNQTYPITYPSRLESLPDFAHCQQSSDVNQSVIFRIAGRMYKLWIRPHGLRERYRLLPRGRRPDSWPGSGPRFSLRRLYNGIRPGTAIYSSYGYDQDDDPIAFEGETATELMAYVEGLAGSELADGAANAFNALEEYRRRQEREATEWERDRQERAAAEAAEAARLESEVGLEMAAISSRVSYPKYFQSLPGFRLSSYGNDEADSIMFWSPIKHGRSGVIDAAFRLWIDKHRAKDRSQPDALRFTLVRLQVDDDNMEEAFANGSHMESIAETDDPKEIVAEMQRLATFDEDPADARVRHLDLQPGIRSRRISDRPHPSAQRAAQLELERAPSRKPRDGGGRIASTEAEELELLTDDWGLKFPRYLLGLDGYGEVAPNMMRFTAGDKAYLITFTDDHIHGLGAGVVQYTVFNDIVIEGAGMPVGQSDVVFSTTDPEALVVFLRGMRQKDATRMRYAELEPRAVAAPVRKPVDRVPPFKRSARRPDPEPEEEPSEAELLELHDVAAPVRKRARLSPAKRKRPELVEVEPEPEGDDLQQRARLLELNPPRTSRAKLGESVPHSKGTRGKRVHEVVARLKHPGFANVRMMGKPEDAVSIARELIADRANEVFIVLFVNVQNHFVGYVEFTEGSPVGVSVHPHGIFKEALLCNGAAFITAHQHPSGNAIPSAEDRDLWVRLRDAGKVMGVPCLDNLVLTQERYFSESVGYPTTYPPEVR